MERNDSTTPRIGDECTSKNAPVQQCWGVFSGNLYMRFELKIMFNLLFIIILPQVFSIALCYGNEPIPPLRRSGLVSVALSADGSTLASDQDNDAVPKPYAGMLTDIFCVGVYGHCFGIFRKYPATGEVRAFSNLGGNYFVSVICCCGDAGGVGVPCSCSNCCGC